MIAAYLFGDFGFEVGIPPPGGVQDAVSAETLHFRFRSTRSLPADLNMAVS